MKKYWLLFLSVLMPACNWFSTSSKGSGSITSQERAVGSFDELKIAGDMMVQLIKADTEHVVISTDDNLIVNVVTEIENGELNIYMKDPLAEPSKPIGVIINYKNLIEIDGAGSVQIHADKLASSKLDIGLSGSCRIDATIETDRLEIEGDGSTKFNFSGSAQRQKMALTGAASYNAGTLKSKNVDISASGSVRITVLADKTIEGTIAGAVLVSYKGDPQVQVKSTGASSIKKVG